MSGFQVAGSAYDRFVGRYSGLLASEFCDEAAVAAGMRALDVGCGPGALTQALASRLGAQALAAVDPSEPFAAACRERVPGADVRVAAAEDLPFGDAEFDAVLSQLVLNFLADAERGLAEMRRVAKPGAVVGAVVWDYAEGMTMLRAFWDVAVSERDEGLVMRFCTPESLGDLWRTGGLQDVRVTAIEVAADYTGFDDLWWPFTQGVGPAGAHVVALPDPERDRLREAYRERLGSPPGPFTLTARAWCAIGRAPAH
jgi:SAM-dependent methyltransferase